MRKKERKINEKGRRAGFTLIELVFVILIIAILGAVALPKLMATRQETDIVKHTNEIKAAIREIINYYNTTGRLEEDGKKMSDIMKKYGSENRAPSDTMAVVTGGAGHHYEADIRFKRDNGHWWYCLEMKWGKRVDTNRVNYVPDDRIVVYLERGALNKEGQTLCAGVAKMLGIYPDGNITIPLRNAQVKY
jgi:prepilin-type N-terminal cleavage/methylation domain-containing protein